MECINTFFLGGHHEKMQLEYNYRRMQSDAPQ